MGQGRGEAPGAGWFDDPTRPARLRYWTGTAWAGWVSDGQAVWLEPMLRRALRSADLDHLAFVEQVFLPEAVARRVLPPSLAPALGTLVERLRAEAQSVLPPAPAPAHAASPGAAAVTAATPAPGAERIGTASHVPAAVPIATVSSVPSPPAAPGPIARWWARSREAIGSDLAVHGLAYLGVLLFFVGAFGLVAFAFGEVASGLRPVAELVIAVVPFVTGALLRRRGAVVVGRSLEVLGGLLLPVMAVTTLVDGVGFPPDLHGTALVVGATASTALIAMAYAAWTRRGADSALRHVVAPAAWFAVGMATLGLAREVPTGKGVATPSAAQAAAMLTALAVSVAWGRFRPQARLARPTLGAAVIGVPVLALMALLAAAAEGWPSIPLLVSGTAVLAALHLLRGSVPSGAVDVTSPLWWAIVWAALSAGPPSTAVIAAVVAVGFVVLLELGAAARRAGDQSPNALSGGEPGGAPVRSAPNTALAEEAAEESVVPGQVEVHPADLGLVLSGLGAAAALLAAWPDPRWASAALGLGAVWAAIRRAAPFSTSQGPAAAGGFLDAVAALLPVFALAAVGRATSPAVAVVTAAAVVAAVTVLAMRPWLRREPEDRYWMRWWQFGVPAVVLAALIVWQPALTTAEKWATTLALALLAGVSTVGPVARLWRPVVVGVLGLATWLTGAATIPLVDLLRIALPALVGLVLVLLVHLTTWRGRVDGGSIALTGHGLAAVAVGMALSTAPAGGLGSVVLPHGQLGWALVAALAAATAGVMVTGWYDAIGRSPVGAMLDGEGWSLRWAPLALAATGLPVTVSVLLEVTGALPLANPWANAVPATAAVAYAAATRFALPARVGRTLSWGGLVAGLVASAGPFGASLVGVHVNPAPGAASTTLGLVLAERSPAIAGLASVILAVLLVRPDRSRPAFTWTAWAAVFPLTGLVTAQAWPTFAALPGATASALTLVAVGGLMLVSAAAADLSGRSWAPREKPSHRGLVAPVSMGALGVVLGLATALAALPPRPAGWVTLIAAVALLATGLCSRAGVLAGASVFLGWLAALLLVGPELAARPWVATLAALALMLVAQAFSALKSWSSRSPQWARWDLPLLVAAAPVGASGPILAAGGTWSGAMLAALGAEALAVAVRFRRTPVAAVPVGGAGAGLLLIGAGSEGPGWLALALLGLALLASGVAVLVEPPARLALQIAGAAAGVGAWRALTEWLGWSDQQSVDVAALWAAGLALGLAAVARLSNPGAAGDPADNAGGPEPSGPARSWLLTWGGAALAVVSITAWDALTAAPVLRSVVAPSWSIMAGLLVTALALAVAAHPLQVPWLRDLAAVHGLAALVVGSRAAQASPAQRVLVLGLVSAAAAAVLLTQTASRAANPERPEPPSTAGGRAWLRPLIVFGAGSASWSVGTATLALTLPVTTPSPALTGPLLLVGPLVAVALQYAAIGVALRQFWLQALAAPVLCVAWVVFADAAFGSDPQWATVPIGLTILVVVGLWRRDRRQRGERLDVLQVVVPEIVGIVFLVGAFFVEAVTHSLWQAVTAGVLGIAVTAWGVLTRVRRRLLVGSAVVGAALLVLVVAPLVRLLPSWEGAGLWVLIAALGLTAVVAASMVERGKVATRKGVARFGALTAGWE